MSLQDILEPAPHLCLRPKAQGQARISDQTVVSRDALCAGFDKKEECVEYKT